MGSISEGFVLRKVTGFAATMGLILATIANLPHSASAANRGGLWAVVHDICVPAYQSIGVGFPCAEVSIADGLERGFAVLRAPSSATHVIVVPTTRISGIESPALLTENAPNYWEAAWGARRSSRKGRAVNCRTTRSEWRLIQQLVAARTSCIFMLPASPRRSLSSCAATKRKFTKLGLFLPWPGDPNVSDKEARSAANCMVLHPACHDDPVEFYNLHGFWPDNLRRK
jgi:hypothetical protein